MQGYLARRESGRLALLARMAQVALGIYIAAWGVVALFSAWQLSLVLTGSYDRTFMMVLSLQGLAIAAGVLVFLLCALLFLLWFHKAVSNLHDARLSGLATGPGWAVGSFFVPAANLFVPFGAMRELWNRSHGEDEWQAKAGVSEVTVWWTCLLAGTLLVALVFFITLFNVTTYMEITTPPGVNQGLSLAGIALWCTSAVMLLRIVGRITKAQLTLSDERLTFA